MNVMNFGGVRRNRTPEFWNGESSRKRVQESTKTFVDNKCEKLQKKTRTGRKAGHPASAFAEAVRTPASHDGRSYQKR